MGWKATQSCPSEFSKLWAVSISSEAATSGSITAAWEGRLRRSRARCPASAAPRTVEASASMSTGLVRYRYAPYSTARTAVSSAGPPVTSTTGTSRDSSRRARRNSIPERRGMLMSLTTASKEPPRTFSRASTPSHAVSRSRPEVRSTFM